MTGATPAWKDRDLRLDPQALPARWSVPTDSEALPAQDASVYMDAAGVIVKRKLSGLPLTLSLPLSAHEGVGIRVIIDGDQMVASVELTHRDPAMTLPLSVTRDMEAAAGDWAEWAESLHLPMLMIEADGTWTKVERQASVPIYKPVPRRRNGVIVKRRPRFLCKRLVGHSGPTHIYKNYREIICYE